MMRRGRIFTFVLLSNFLLFVLFYLFLLCDIQRVCFLFSTEFGHFVFCGLDGVVWFLVWFGMVVYQKSWVGLVIP